MTGREIVARGDGFALAEVLDGDLTRLSDDDDGAFVPDRDETPPSIEIHRLVVTTADGADVLGDVSWHPVLYGPSVRSRAWDIGIELLPSARSRGIGTGVIRTLVLHLFGTTEAHRVQASTDVTNIPAQRALEKAGFTREGIIRGAQSRDGEYRDLVAYGLLRTEVTGEKLTASQNAFAELDSRDG